MQALASGFEGLTMDKYTAMWMFANGWCDNCDGDPAQCIINGFCILEEKDEGGDDSEQKLV